MKFVANHIYKEYSQSDDYNCGFFGLINIGLTIATAHRCRSDLHHLSPEMFAKTYTDTIIAQKKVDEMALKMRDWLFSIITNCSVLDKCLKVTSSLNSDVAMTSNIDLTVTSDDSIPNHTSHFSVNTASSLPYKKITVSYEDIVIDGFPLRNNLKIPSMTLSTIIFLQEFDQSYEIFLQPLINEFPVYNQSFIDNEEDNPQVYHFVVYNKTDYVIKEPDFYESSDSDDEQHGTKKQEFEDINDDLPEPYYQIFKISDNVKKFVDYKDKSLRGSFIPMGFGIISGFFCHDDFITFLKDISTLDLFRKEDMVSMDSLLLNLSKTRYAHVIGLSNGYKSKYRLYFKDHKLSETQKQKSPYRLFKDFSFHFRCASTLRMGTILGTHSLFKLYKTFFKSKVPIESPKEVPCFVSNFDDDDITGRSWTTQLQELRRYSIHDYYQSTMKKLYDVTQPVSKIVNDTNESGAEISVCDYVLPKEILEVTNSIINISNFPFPINVPFKEMNLSLILLFHERSNDEQRILQPPINHRSINHASLEFRSFFNQMKKGNFRDQSTFHFLAYRLNNLTLAHSKQMLVEERRIVAIDGETYTTKKKNVSKTSTTFFFGERLSNEFFLRYLVPFIHNISSLDLFKKDDMIKMDRIFSLDRSVMVYQYKRFFVNDKLSAAQQEASSQSLFRDFCTHFRKHSVIRLGTIEGIHRLYSVFQISSQENINENDQYIRGMHKCIITNLKDYSGDEGWKAQIHALRRYSKIYERQKSQIVTTSFIEIIDHMCRSFRDLRNDIYRQRSAKENLLEYFGNIIYPICQQLQRYIKEEAEAKITDRSHGFQNISFESMNPIVLEIWKSCPLRNRNEKFWKWIDFDPISDMKSRRPTSINIKTIRFHYRSTLEGAVEHQRFRELFGIYKSSTDSNTKQSYVIHTFRNFLICINISYITYASFINKITDIRKTNERRFHEEQNDERDDKEPNNKISLRTMDHKLLSK